MNRQGEPCRQQFRCRGSSPCVEWKKGAFHFRRKRTKRVTTEREEEKNRSDTTKTVNIYQKAHRKGPIGTSHRGAPRNNNNNTDARKRESIYRLSSFLLDTPLSADKLFFFVSFILKAFVAHRFSCWVFKNILYSALKVSPA